VHCQALGGKYGAAVVTAGGGEEEPIAEYLNHFLAISGAIPVGAVWATMGTLSGDLPEPIRAQAFALGKKLVDAWKNREPSSRFAQETSRFRERMRWLMLSRKEEWPYEYEYWKKYRGLKA
jgi:hypothetical protein